METQTKKLELLMNQPHKILAIGYYDDFARFFLDVFKKLRSKGSFQITYLNLYFSGFLFCLSRFKFHGWINPKILWLILKNTKKYENFIAEKKDVYKGINVEKVINYHMRLPNPKKRRLTKTALAYIDLFHELIDIKSPDLLFLSGDSRMSVEILIEIANSKNIPCLHFEQAPFGCTIVDPKGVNANASVRNFTPTHSKRTPEELRIENTAFMSRSKEKKYKRNPIFRGFDYLFQLTLGSSGLLTEDTKMPTEYKSYVTTPEAKHFKFNENDNQETLDLLLILQVPFDVNMIYHSNLFKNHYEVVANAIRSIPSNSRLRVREHPLYKGKYEPELYEVINSSTNVFIDSAGLIESIEASNIVIVNNSTVGIEALAQNKPVISLGNSYYDSVCFKINSPDELNATIESITKSGSKQKPEAQLFLRHLFKQYYIEGHYRDNTLICAEPIAEKIISFIEDPDQARH